MRVAYPLLKIQRVLAGTVREEKLERAAGKAVPPPTPTAATYRGRVIIFFIDDLHLSAASVQRTRKAILEFVDNEMGIEDQVAIEPRDMGALRGKVGDRDV